MCVCVCVCVYERGGMDFVFCNANLILPSPLCPLPACTHSETKERMGDLNEFLEELRTQVSYTRSDNVSTLTPTVTVTDSGGGGADTELDGRAH